MPEFMIERTVKGSRDMIWKKVCDFHQPPCTQCEIRVVKEGDPARHDVGLERKLSFSGGIFADERITEVNPVNSFSYRISGIPARHYVGKAEFIDQGEFTKVRWSGRFHSVFPGMGRMVVKTAQKNVNQILDDLNR